MENFLKLFKASKNLYSDDLKARIMTQKIYEKNIPGTSAKLFFSFIPLFVYLKHHSSLIPTPHILYENPKMVSKITIPNNFSSKYITSNLEESLSIDDIFIIVSDNQFYGIGKVVKQNKRKVIEIIFQINDPIYKFLIEKYGEPRLLIENASVEEEKTSKIQEIDDDKTQTNETKIDDDQSINEALAPEEIAIENNLAMSYALQGDLKKAESLLRQAMTKPKGKKVEENARKEERTLAKNEPRL